ncbi:methyltransferase [Streptomyces albireticuli]|uniref:methyltransferase n=1 Tax=Streptomyces albireticuli TaxID=1940 RepID=UPI0036B55765
MNRADTATTTAADAALLVDMALGHLASAALRTAVDLRIADHLADGPLHPDELGRRTGARGTHLGRVLTFLASRGVFREDHEGAFHLTPAAALLRTGVPGSQHPGIVMITDDMYRRTSGGLTETVRTGEPSFARFHGAPYFAYLESDAAAREVFDAGMAAFSAPADALVAEVYDFPATGTVVDVGGGRGGLLREILERHPGLHGVLFDRGVTTGDHILDAPHLAGRRRVEAGDFFDAVPAGGDLYVLKQILHDWDDTDASRILRSCRSAMAAGSRLLVIDALIPPGNDPHPGKALDLAMMTLFDSAERDLDALDALLSRAGLRRTRVVPTPSPATIVEAVAG